jgi:hippurate hydrolase
MHVDAEVYQLKDRLTQHRRHLHKYPETGFDVSSTRDYILSWLKKWGFDEIRIVAGSGIKAVMKGKDGGTTLAFRADMDALPLNEKTGIEFASVNCGRMHACGHDGHMAILLGLAEWLSLRKEELKGNVVLIFQPAEETVGGALPMIKEGVLENPGVDAIFGFHLLPDIPQGKIGLKAGPVMAQTCEFTVEVTGKSAHGAMPHRGVDALLAACYFVNAVHGLIGRWVSPDDKALLTIGKLHAGENRNIIAGKATIEGIIRTFDDGVYERIKESIQGLLSGLELSHQVKAQYREDVYYPVVNNDANLVSQVEKFLPPDVLQDIQPLMIAEDFSYYQQRVPGVYMFLGCRNESKGFTAPLHSSKFNFDEEVLLYGLQIYHDIIKGFGVVR